MRAAGPQRAGDGGEVLFRPGSGPCDEFPGMHAQPQAAERRRADRPPVGAGLAFGKHRLHAEAPHRFRSDPGRNSTFLVAHALLRAVSTPVDTRASSTLLRHTAFTKTPR